MGLYNRRGEPNAINLPFGDDLIVHPFRVFFGTLLSECPGPSKLVESWEDASKIHADLM